MQPGDKVVRVMGKYKHADERWVERCRECGIDPHGPLTVLGTNKTFIKGMSKPVTVLNFKEMRYKGWLLNNLYTPYAQYRPEDCL